MELPRPQALFSGIARWLLPAAAALAVGCAEERASPRPRSLTIAFTNDMQGEIRSCGCASKDQGGLGRRATFLEAVRDTAGDFLLLEGGGFFSSKLSYGKEKADLTIKAMALIGYDAVAVGEDEFGFGVDYIVERTREMGLPVLAANVADGRADTLLFPPARELELPSGLRVGIIGLTSDKAKLPPQVPPGRVRILDPVAAARTQAAALSSVDVLMVVANMTRPEVMRLAAAVPGIDVIAFGSEARAMRNIRPKGGAYFLQTAPKGRYVGVAYAALGPDNRVRSMQVQMRELDQQYPDHETMSRLFEAYDMNIAFKERGEQPPGAYEALQGVKKPFAGAETCRPCHEAIQAQWEATAHAHAFETLVAKQRQLDRDCVPCHTTGFYERGGFERVDLTPNLAGVQCESCHGNSREHVKTPAMRTPSEARASCRACHTVDQTPDFAFETFWARIRH
jgi:nitrate/TMAO reductase-like tetraheme cytochrome c subunit